MSDQLSPMEAIMWRVGHDATLRMTVGALLVVERPPDPIALLERIRLASPARAAAAPATRRRDDRPHPPGLDRRCRSDARAPRADALGRRAGVPAPGARPRRPARVGAVRSGGLAVGPDGGRRPRGRPRRDLRPCPPRADRRRRRHPAARGAPRRARGAAGPARPPPAPAGEDGRGTRARRRSPSGHVHDHDRPAERHPAARRRRQHRLRRRPRSTPPCASPSGRSTSPTRCPAS